MASYEFKSLGDYKDLIFKLLMFSGEKSELLMEIIMPVLDDDRFDKYDNFLGGEFEYYSGGKVERVNLQGRLFNVPFIYSTITESICAICMDTNLKKCNQNTKEMIITLTPMCHKEMLSLDKNTKRKFKSLGYTGNRLDIVVALIGEILNFGKDSKLGIGTLIPAPFDSITPFYPNNSFFGKTMIYTCSDFMVNYGDRSLNGD